MIIPKLYQVAFFLLLPLYHFSLQFMLCSLNGLLHSFRNGKESEVSKIVKGTFSWVLYRKTRDLP